MKKLPRSDSDSCAASSAADAVSHASPSVRSASWLAKGAVGTMPFACVMPPAWQASRTPNRTSAGIASNLPLELRVRDGLVPEPEARRVGVPAVVEEEQVLVVGRRNRRVLREGRLQLLAVGVEEERDVGTLEPSELAEHLGNPDGVLTGVVQRVELLASLVDPDDQGVPHYLRMDRTNRAEEDGQGWCITAPFF